MQNPHESPMHMTCVGMCIGDTCGIIDTLGYAPHGAHYLNWVHSIVHSASCSVIREKARCSRGKPMLILPLGYIIPLVFTPECI